MAQNERRALYPGSFDPPTNGHAWVMGRVADDFDTGFVAVGYNPEKAGRFPVSERVEMLKEIAQKHPNLVVTTFLGMYQADFAEMLGAKTIVRGMRATDYDSENNITQVNRGINGTVETIFSIPPNELLQVSSSMVMGLVGFEGWEPQVRKMVPVTVFDRIARFQQEKDKQALGKRWEELHKRLQAGGNAKLEFDDLYERYREAQRSYHTLSHIKTCLNELELVRDRLADADAVELALWFHDSVYESSKPKDPQKQVKTDDEGQSAELASLFITEDMGLPKDFADTVAKLILATKHTVIPQTSDEKYMVDIDLAILGRSQRLFDVYEEQIREEYAWVPEDVFKEARSKVLSSFLVPNRPLIYTTDFFRERYERQAQENVKRSITNLTSGK